MISRNMKLFMFAALAILMASACVMISENSEDTDAVSNHGSSSSPLSSFSYDAYTLSQDSSKTYYVAVGSSVSITAGSFTTSSSSTYNYFYPTSVSSGFGLSKSGTTVSGTISKAGSLSIAVYKSNDKGNTTSAFTLSIIAVDNSSADTEVIPIVYNANGGTGGPGTKNHTFTCVGTVYTTTLSTSVPTRSGYTFQGWSASSTATTASHSAGAEFAIPNQIIWNGLAQQNLYAVWEQNATSYTCYLYYNANGGSGAPSTQSYTGTGTSNHSFTISSSTPTKSGYTFLGWSTSSSATSASYSAGSSISVSYNGSKTLYAVWQSNAPATYTVTVYKGNWDSFKWVSGSDTTKYTSSSHTYTVTAGSSFDIDWYGKSSESGSGTGYTYTTTYTTSNYNMATSLYGTSLGDSVTINSSGSYYPAVQMTSTTTYTYSYTITYNANGGSGAPSDTTTTGSSTSKSITLSSTTPTRSGYTFLGWSTSSTASSASYSAGSSYTFNYGTTNLYAVWKAATITVSGTPDSYGVVGSSWSFKPTVSESGCSVSISGASWLSANGTNVSGTPTSPGSYNVTLTFSKTGFTSVTKTFSITVLSALSFESSPTGGAIIYAV